jgi:hypothetical protein
MTEVAAFAMSRWVLALVVTGQLDGAALSERQWRLQRPVRVAKPVARTR